MINTTNRPLIISKLIHEDCVLGIHATLEVFDQRWGECQFSQGWHNVKHAFQYIFHPLARNLNGIFDEDFIFESFNFVMNDRREDGCSILSNILARYSSQGVPAHGIADFRRGIRHLLVQLWNQGAVLFPMNFKLGRDFHPVSENEIFDFARSYARLSDKTSGADITTADRIWKYVPRVALASKWSSIESFSIYEWSELHRADLDGGSRKLGPVPWGGFPAELVRVWGNRASIDAGQLHLYSRWTLEKHYNKFSFKEFEKQHGEIDRRRDTQRALVQKEHERRRPKTRNVDPGVLSRHLISQAQRAAVREIECAHDAAMHYFAEHKRLRGDADPLSELPRYAGREHVDLKSYAAIWHQLFSSYERFRKIDQGHESDSYKNDLRVLADYLFLYLPWWKEIYPESNVELPASPKLLTRYLFVKRLQDEPLERAPKTLIEMTGCRRTTNDSKYAAIIQFEKLFLFIEENYRDNDDIAGSSYRNPIGETDRPPVARPGKSNKQVFSEEQTYWLRYYGYSVESFGEYLLERALEIALSTVAEVSITPVAKIGLKDLARMARMKYFDTELFGYVPIVRVRGKFLPLYRVPNVFQWHSRDVKYKGGVIFCRLIPHLTVLRVLLFGVETGQRYASVRWLDVRSWHKGHQQNFNSSGRYEPISTQGYSVWVNTDKSSDEGRFCPVNERAWSLLHRERRFRELFAEEFLQKEVLYKFRETTRFGYIQPLFVAASACRPINESIYADYWVDLLLACQIFVNDNIEFGHAFVKLVPTHSVPSIAYATQDKGEDAPYTRMSLLAIATPHANRTTFITHASSVLDISETAEAVGHRNLESTAYYTKPPIERIASKVAESDVAVAERIMGPAPAYIRADLQDSALVRGFRTNRAETIEAFGFMPSLGLWEPRQAKSLLWEGDERLRNSPFSRLVFRETHVCVVGEECPPEVVEITGGRRHCGMCPLGMKCVDHLTAIAARRSYLYECIVYLRGRCEKLEAAGEGKAAQEMREKLATNISELTGWKIAEDTLTVIREEIERNISQNPACDAQFYTSRPEIVKQHLEKIAKHSTEAEFVLQRMLDSDAYPSMETPHVSAAASKLRRRLMAGKDEPGLAIDQFGSDDVKIVASHLRLLMQVHGVTLSQVAKLLEEGVTLPLLSKASLSMQED